MRLHFIVITIALLLAGCQNPPTSGSSGSQLPPGSLPPSPSGTGAPQSPSTSNPLPSTPAGLPGGDSQTSDDAEAGENTSGSGDSGDSLEDLESTFEEALEDFDETIRVDETADVEDNPEDIDILDPTNNSGSEGFDDAYDEPASSGQSSGSTTPEPPSSSPPSDSSEQNPTSSSSQTASSSSQKDDIEASQLPPDIGDGRGDDIVARQMREAAIHEKDPELKEKLWEEYRKYRKGGT